MKILSINSLLPSTLALVSVIAFSGCSSKMTKQECQSTDYYQMGLKDGEKGKTSDKYNEVAQECAAQGEVITGTKYNDGRQAGLAKYCTESRGKSDAKDLKSDSICLKEAVPPYVAQYQKELGKLKEKQDKQLASLKKSDEKTQKKEQDLQNNLNKIESEQKSSPQ